MTSTTHQAQTRRYLLAQYDRLERILAGLIANPGPAVANGAIIHDTDGQPVPNLDVRREATFTLAHLRDARAHLLGQDLGNPN